VLTRLPPQFIETFSGAAWTLGIIAPSAGLLHVLALTIGSSTSAEEYELGTADYWMTRPLKRSSYFLGKTVGGLVLLSLIIFTYSILSLAVSWYVFGPQARVETFPIALAASIASAAPFYALGLALGELLRRSMMSTIVAGAVFFASVLVETYANFVALISGDLTLREVVKLLPSWAATGLTPTILTDSVGLSINTPGAPFIGFGAENLWTAVSSLLIYSAVFFLVAWLRFRHSDVTRRAL
jgi:ABC-2 type transport system permease protein